MTNTNNTLPPIPQVGTKEYYAFRKYVWEIEGFHTRMRLTSLKTEYLNRYWTDFNKLKKIFVPLTSNVIVVEVEKVMESPVSQNN